MSEKTDTLSVADIQKLAKVPPKNDTENKAEVNEAIKSVIAKEMERATKPYESPRKVEVSIKEGIKALSLKRYTGHNDGADITKSNMYFSERKGLSFYIDDNTLIQFQNQLFYTDDEDLISYMESNPKLNIEFWKDELPEAIKKKKEQDEMYLTYDEKEHG